MKKFADLLASLSRFANAAGVQFPDAEAEPRDMTIRDLLETRIALVTVSRHLLSEMQGDPSPAEERKLGDAHDNAMKAFDAIDAEKKLRDVERTHSRELRSAESRRPIGEDIEDDGFLDGEESQFRVSERPPAANLNLPEVRWSDEKGKEVRVLAPRERYSTRDYKGIQLGTVLRAMVCGARNDAERRALSEGTDSAGGFTVPKPLAAEVIDRLRARSVCVRAGARTVPMEHQSLAIARLETDPTVVWRAENDAITPSDPTFAKVQLDAKNMACLVKVSRELLADTINAEEALERAFMGAFALEFDRACLYGTGASNQPTGVGVIAGTNSVSMGTNGATLVSAGTYPKIIDTIYEMQLDNAADPTAMIYHPRTGASIAKTQDGVGNPIQVPEMVARIPKLTTTSIPINQTQGTSTDCSSIIIGDFTQMLIGLRESMKILVLQERYMDSGQYGFIAFMRGDVQFAHLESFSKLIGIRP